MRMGRSVPFRSSYVPPISSYGGVLGLNPPDAADLVDRKIMFVPQGRHSINLSALCMNIICPPLLFAPLYAVMIFKYHYEHPDMAYLLIASAFGASVILATIGSIRKSRDAAPAWFCYAALACFLSAALALVLGNLVFWTFMEPYYDYGTLNTYSAINPGKYKGTMLADAGRIYFTSGSTLEIKKTMGFKHKDTYCVAPVSYCEADGTCNKMQTYDFWAVGVNCCSSADDFKFNCGEAKNYNVRSALRNINEELNPFFRLAVQQAEAAYGITATHPIFFHWVQDPVKEMENLRTSGLKYFAMGVFMFSLFNVFCVITATFGFGKMHKNGYGYN